RRGTHLASAARSAQRRCRRPRARHRGRGCRRGVGPGGPRGSAPHRRGPARSAPARHPPSHRSPAIPGRHEGRGRDGPRRVTPRRCGTPPRSAFACPPTGRRPPVTTAEQRPTPFRMPEHLFAELAAGGGSAEALAFLERAERARRLLLLRTVLDHLQDLPTPLTPAAEAWRLLKEAAERAPSP